MSDTILSGLVGAIIGFVSSFLLLRLEYKKLYADTVSKSRDKWLTETRNLICTMLFKKRELLKATTKEKAKIEEYYYYVKDNVILRLNLNEKVHLLLFSEINKLDNCSDLKNFEKAEKRILHISRLFLKNEWDTVKKEAKGKK